MSTVIKAGEAVAKFGSLRSVNLNDHMAEARAIVERARKDAEKSKRESEQEGQALFKRVREKAYAEGYELGLVEGREVGRKEAFAEATTRFDEQHGGIVTTFQQAIDDIESLRKDLAIKAERDLLQFSVGLASHLTYAIGRLDDRATVANLQRALRVVGSKTDLRIHVNPRNLMAIRDFANTVLEKFGQTRHIEVSEDSDIKPGGCMVRTAETEVDATLEHQLDHLVRLLLGEEPADG